jgi:hypothetical protein
MAYVPAWEWLSVTRDRVMAAAGLSKDEAQQIICRAIADRNVNIRGQLNKHATKPMRASNVLEGRNFEIPTTLNPEDLDWEQSRPVKPWVVLRGAFDPAGYWDLKRIELSQADVTNTFCTTEQAGESVRRAPSETGATSSRLTLESNPIGPGPRPSDPQSPGAAGSPRRRGVPPRKFEQTKAAMRADIQQQRRSVAELKNTLEKELSASYGVSRDTARRARRAVLSEFGED